MKTFFTSFMLIVFCSGFSLAQAQDEVRTPASFRPKTIIEEVSGQDKRDTLPTLVAPTEKSSASGIDFALIYKGEFSSVLNGGIKQQSSYLENLDVRLNFDLAKLAGLQGGSVFLYGLGNRGATDANSPTANVGDIQGTSNIQTATSQFILYEAWYQQMFFEQKMSLLVGLHDLNSEFYSSDSAALFFNSNFGIGKEMSQTAVNGPSIFPVTSLAVRLKAEPSENFYIQTAIFNAQAGDPNSPQAIHIRGFGDDGMLSVTEMGLIDVITTHSKFAVGLWSYDRTFEAINDPTLQVTSKGSYGVVDIELSKNLHSFLKYGRASTASNNVGASLAAGVQWQNLFSEAWQDRLGIGFTQVSFGKEYLAAQQAGGINTADTETALELSYRFEILPGVALQPDFQYVITPSGNKDIPDAQVGTLRVEIGL